MELDTKKFCKNFAVKLDKLQDSDLELNTLFHYVHELNGVAISYGFSNIGFVTVVAHELIFELQEKKIPLTKDMEMLFHSYFEMLEEIFREGSENHLNTKEALHLLDDFKFQLGQISEKDVA